MTAWWNSKSMNIAEIDMFRLFDAVFKHEVRIVARAR